jgi:hypothetical protein
MAGLLETGDYPPKDHESARKKARKKPCRGCDPKWRNPVQMPSALAFDALDSGVARGIQQGR